MAGPEPAKNSSSRNVKISELRQEGAEGRTLRVLLDDGSLFLFSADSAAAGRARNMFSSAAEMDEDAFCLFEQASQQWGCRKKALELLARAEQYRRGLEVKLIRKNYSRETVSAVLDEMENSGLLDDSRYARSWARSRLRRSSCGPARLTAGLRAKGIQGKLASEAVNEVLEETGEEAVDEALERAWRKICRRGGRNENQITAALVRRGFSYSRVKKFLKQQYSG